ncbi:hypothetical protein HOLleu_27060 [Holothuria leucospilota]|uniref:Uncharacterized protein n=1 Tax=Holothuria leucospilota TaxID=206669 RepID=A0A9Q1H392_HOLLE|nr:hypothetical protein HOLleu_27060 [Holothuria leucospilota]
MDCLMKAYHGGVMSLQEYLHRILPELINQELTVNPRKGFQLFLSKTVVGLHMSNSVQKRTVVCARSETDEQTQVVQEVVHELLKSGRSNVLTLGLPKSLPCDAGLSFHSDHNYPQLITPHWSKLLQMCVAFNLLYTEKVFFLGGGGGF